MQTLPFEAAPTPQAPALTAASRIGFIDIAKAIGIVLVVVAHAPCAPTGVMTLIYSVHMPLFFFISGYLFTAERAAAPWPDTVRRAARSLLVPYLFFFGLSLLYWLATRNIGARTGKFSDLHASDALQGLATGLSADLFVNVTLWFFPCLFLCQVLYAWGRQLAGAGALLLGLSALAAVLLATTLPWSVRLPLGLDVVWMALVFYAAGHWLRMIGWPGRSAARASAARVVALLSWAVLWLLSVQVQGRVDLAAARFGAFPVLYLPCALAGIAVVVCVARLVSPSPAWRWLAENSLVIFPLHPLMINFLSGLLQMSGSRTLLEGNPPIWWALSSLWGLLASLPVALLLRRHAPGLLGLRS